MRGVVAFFWCRLLLGVATKNPLVAQVTQT